MGLTQIEQDFKDYKKEQKQTIKALDDRLDAVSDKTNANELNIEWLMKTK
jgi:hypothetical protein